MSDSNATQDKYWNWRPELPLDKPTPFQWPPSPSAIGRWLKTSWFSASTLVLWVLLAVLTWFLLLPDLQRMQYFALDWVLQIYVKNVFLLCLVAGTLHWYLYQRKAQGKTHKFTHEGMACNKKLFKFADQLKDNMFWALLSGAGIWTAYEVLYFWALANAYLPFASFLENPVWFVLWFPLISLCSSAHFYWIHRFLHWPPMYRRFHALHHRNINIGPWSGLSMHPVEHLLYFNSVIIHFVVASHPLHVLYHFYLQGLNPLFSHSGFAHIFVKDKKLIAAGDFFHQLHHRHFECNFGTSEMPWDAWFGSYHDGTQEAARLTRKRMLEKHKQNKIAKA